MLATMFKLFGFIVSKILDYLAFQYFNFDLMKDILESYRLINVIKFR